MVNKKNIAAFKLTDNKFYNRKITFLAVAVILIITSLVFYNSLNNGFIENWDDNINVTQNNYIKDFSWHGVKTLFSQKTNIGEPRLTLFTFMIQYKIWKLNPLPYHFANLLLHLLNIILVFFFIRLLTKNTFIALLTALLFALHPLRIEAVSWITGRKDLLFSFFFLSSLVVYINYLKKKENVLLFFLVIALSYLSFLSKIQAVSLPIVLLAIDIYFKRKIDIAVLFEKALILVIMLFVIGNIALFTGLLFIFIIYHFRDKISKASLIINLNKLINKILIVIFIILCLFLIINLKNWRSATSVLIMAITLLFFFIIDIKNITQWLLLKFSNLKLQKALSYSFIIIASCLFIYYLTQNLSFWTKDLYSEYGFFQRILMMGYSLFFYLIKFIFPFKLCAIYPYPKLVNGSLPILYSIYTILSAVSLVLFILLIKKLKDIRAELIFGFLFFLINIFLVLHLIPIEGRVIAAERYTYLAYIGLFFIISVLIFRLLSNTNSSNYLKKSVLIFSLLYLISFIYTDINRNRVWKSGFTLFTDIIEKMPNYDLAYNNRGMLYYNVGDIENALKDYNGAISANPDFNLAYYNRALLFVNESKFMDAISDCNIAIKKDSNYFDALYLRGYANNKISNFGNAVLDYNKVIKINPNHLLAFYNRGNSKKNLSNYKGAIEDYSKAIELKPNFSEAYNGRGVAKYFIEDYVGSINDYDLALKFNSSNGNVYYNKAMTEIKMNRTNDACANLEKALQLGYYPAKDLITSNCK
jgi:tetratricopeptide (TPR) repeat protein